MIEPELKELHNIIQRVEFVNGDTTIFLNMCRMIRILYS